MRLASLLGFGAALMCAAFLVACGGGGSGSTPGAGGSLTGSHTTNSKPGTTMTIVIHRDGGSKKYLTKSSARHRTAQATRTPKYISYGAQGLQVTISGTGLVSQTVYADLTGSLCSTSGSIETCTLSLPTIGTNEQFSILEVDQKPTGETGGSQYGTAFPAGSNILGAVNQAETVQLGASNSLAIEIGGVDDGFYDVSCFFSVPTPMPSAYSANFGIDGSGVNNASSGYDAGARVVVTQGVAATGTLQMVVFDADGDCFFDATPAPFVDVNGSPTPITVTSNSSALTVAPVVANGTSPPASAFTQTASIANDGYMWYGCNFVIPVKTSSSFASASTITLNNNLTALNSFLSPAASYASTMTYTVVPISVSASTATVSQSGTVYLTATDYGAANGVDGESSYTAGDDELCKTGGGTPLAYAYANGSINTSTWQQQIEIDGYGGGTGTCTFYVFDYAAGTVTTPVTVTVTP